MYQRKKEKPSVIIKKIRQEDKLVESFKQFEEIEKKIKNNNFEIYNLIIDLIQTDIKSNTLSTLEMKNNYLDKFYKLEKKCLNQINVLKQFVHKRIIQYHINNPIIRKKEINLFLNN